MILTLFDDRMRGLLSNFTTNEAVLSHEELEEGSRHFAKIHAVAYSLLKTSGRDSMNQFLLENDLYHEYNDIIPWDTLSHKEDFLQKMITSTLSLVNTGVLLYKPNGLQPNSEVNNFLTQMGELRTRKKVVEPS